MREKLFSTDRTTEAEFEENKIKAFSTSESSTASYRIYRDGLAGIHYQTGLIADAEGFRLASDRLNREYDYQPLTEKRSRNLVENTLTAKELFVAARELISDLSAKYPDFIFSGGLVQYTCTSLRTNEAGLELTNTDGGVRAGFSFKHKASKDISDGWFSLLQRTYDPAAVMTMAGEYLDNYDNMLELPEEVIIQSEGMFAGLLTSSLNGEALALGTSLLSGKLEKPVFSPQLTLYHDTTPEKYFTVFWDGEGFTNEGDRRIFIDKGIPLYGATDRKTAARYGIPHTGNATESYADLPTPGMLISSLAPSDKTAKELLGGRYSILPIQFSGGGYNEKGDYAMPIHNSLLCDGEHIIGRLPAFTISGNLFGFFGDGYLGTACDKPVTQTPCTLIRVSAELIK